jgi:anion-transporting  ArsA/GET3 family ATPase
MSSTFAGTQEYMAMEKLGQLRAANEWDLIVVDTPPSRSALDFLDAPARLARFLDGRMLRLLLAPARAGGRSMFNMMTAASAMFTRVVHKIVGGQLLTDLSGFVSALDSMFGGFRERAEQTYRILQDRETAFLVVAAPEQDALREATFFSRRLGEERMPLAGLILNKVHRVEAAGLPADESLAAASTLDDLGDHAATADTLRIHAALVQQTVRENRVAAEFRAAHPTVPVATVAALASDVHDLDGLRDIGAALVG